MRYIESDVISTYMSLKNRNGRKRTGRILQRMNEAGHVMVAVVMGGDEGGGVMRRTWRHVHVAAIHRAR